MVGIGISPGDIAVLRYRDRVAPTITSDSTANCAENATLAHALTASETVTWTITGGADAARFEISGSTLRWASNGTKNYEAPDDANTDNAYVVQVTATDAALNATNQTVTITVTNVLEVTLAALSLDDLTIAEDQVQGTKVGTITGGTAGSTITLHAQSNADMFQKDGSDIEVGSAGLDFETVPSPTVTLRETHADASNSPRDTVIQIEVTDVSEGPSYGPELVVNGGFAADTDWSLGSGVTISTGKLRFTNSTFGSATQEPNPFTEGLTYHTEYTIDSITEGGVQIVIGGEGFGIVRTTAGTFTEDIVAGFDEGIGPNIQTNGTETSAVIDNVSVKLIL